MMLARHSKPIETSSRRRGESVVAGDAAVGSLKRHGGFFDPSFAPREKRSAAPAKATK